MISSLIAHALSHLPRLPALTTPGMVGSRVTALRASTLNGPAPMVLSTDVWQQIRTTVGSRPAETGGPLGGARGSGVVTRYAFDSDASTTGVVYYPDVKTLNEMFKRDWNPNGTNLLGFVHSHPAGTTRPSHGDLRYARDILRAIPELERLLIPIVQSETDTGTFSLRAFAARNEGSRTVLDDLPLIVRPAPAPLDPSALPELDRVRDAYDLHVMAHTRVVAVGCGGSATFLEDLARAGVGEFVLLDPDVIEPANVGTQQAYLSDVGRDKVEVLAQRLTDINSRTRVWTVRARLEELTDSGMRRLSVGWLPSQDAGVPATTLLCAFTDDFHAQARVSRVGLHLGLPVLGGVVYHRGLGVELSFSAPGVTTACIRCALAGRYRAYLEDGYANDVTSAGTPISATSRLNALKMPVALGLLHTLSPHADTSNPATVRHRELLTQVAHRNLVQVNLAPSTAATLGLAVFDRVAHTDPAGRLAVDTTVWLHQDPDGPSTGRVPCPDCGGTGDLTTSINRFIDTRPIPHVFGDFRR